MSLRKEVRTRQPRGNRFWYKLAALSFTVKVGICIALFFAMHAMFS